MLSDTQRDRKKGKRDRLTDREADRKTDAERKVMLAPMSRLRFEKTGLEQMNITKHYLFV